MRGWRFRLNKMFSSSAMIERKCSHFDWETIKLNFHKDVSTTYTTYLACSEALMDFIDLFLIKIYIKENKHTSFNSWTFKFLCAWCVNQLCQTISRKICNLIVPSVTSSAYYKHIYAICMYIYLFSLVTHHDIHTLFIIHSYSIRSKDRQYQSPRIPNS